MSELELNPEVRMTVTIPAKELFRLAEQILNMRYALERIRDCDWPLTPSRDYWMQKIAREALE